MLECSDTFVALVIASVITVRLSTADMSRAYIRAMRWEGPEVDDMLENAKKQEAAKKEQLKRLRDQGDFDLRQRGLVAAKRAFFERWFSVESPPLPAASSGGYDD